MQNGKGQFERKKLKYSNEEKVLVSPKVRFMMQKINYICAYMKMQVCKCED